MSHHARHSLTDDYKRHRLNAKTLLFSLVSFYYVVPTILGMLPAMIATQCSVFFSF